MDNLISELVETFGGRVIYIPKKLKNKSKINILDNELRKKLIINYGGEYIYVNKGLPKKIEIIDLLLSGYSVNYCSDKFKVSLRYVQKLKKIINSNQNIIKNPQ
jgi:hypothetical protein